MNQDEYTMINATDNQTPETILEAEQENTVNNEEHETIIESAIADEHTPDTNQAQIEFMFELLHTAKCGKRVCKTSAQWAVARNYLFYALLAQQRVYNANQKIAEDLAFIGEDLDKNDPLYLDVIGSNDLQTHERAAAEAMPRAAFFLSLMERKDRPNPIDTVSLLVNGQAPTTDIVAAYVQRWKVTEEVAIEKLTATQAAIRGDTNGLKRYLFQAVRELATFSDEYINFSDLDVITVASKCYDMTLRWLGDPNATDETRREGWLMTDSRNRYAPVEIDADIKLIENAQTRYLEIIAEYERKMAQAEPVDADDVTAIH